MPDEVDCTEQIYGLDAIEVSEHSEILALLTEINERLIDLQVGRGYTDQALDEMPVDEYAAHRQRIKDRYTDA